MLRKIIMTKSNFLFMKVICRAMKKKSLDLLKMATRWRQLPDTILQLMVIGWNDFPGDSAGLGGWAWGTILQFAVIGWKAEFPWEPRVILSLALGRVGVRSPAARPELWPPVDLPTSALVNPGSRWKITCHPNFIWYNSVTELHK